MSLQAQALGLSWETDVIRKAQRAAFLLEALCEEEGWGERRGRDRLPGLVRLLPGFSSLRL